MWVYHTDTLSVVEVNDAAVEKYGYSSEEFLGMQATAFDVDRATSANVAERKHKVKRGKLIDVEVIEHPIDWGDRQATLVVAKDVTEQKRLQKEFTQAQKMEAIGRLAAGVAHDFNNLLTVVNGYSGSILEGLQKSDRYYIEISEILRAGERAASLTTATPVVQPQVDL